MARVLLVTKGDKNGLNLKASLEAIPFYSVEMVNNSAAAIRKIKDHEDWDMLVLHLETFSQKNADMIASFRTLGFEKPLIVASPLVAANMYSAIEHQEKAVILELPFEEKDLLGITSKLLTGKKVPQRIHRRFYTNQVGTVESFEDGKTNDAVLFNLSKGGAQLFLSATTGFKKGDLVRLNVPLDKLNKVHQINGKVVWIKDTSQNGNVAAAVGVEFVSTNEVYRHLLMNM